MGHVDLLKCDAYYIYRIKLHTINIILNEVLKFFRDKSKIVQGNPINELSPSGKALDSDSSIRRFESYQLS